MTLEKVISGGQTGVDAGALRAARSAGIATGGTAPKGFRTESGSGQWLEGFGLTESLSSNYRDRTIANIRDADATLIFEAVKSPGTALTIRECERSCKPFKIVRAREPMIPAVEVADWLRENGVRTVNCAGHRESVAPGIGALVEAYLGRVFGELKGAMTMAKRKKVDGTMSLEVNGYTLEGEEVDGRWRWRSVVAGITDGMTMEDAVAAFMKVALAGAVTVKQLAR